MAKTKEKILKSTTAAKETFEVSRMLRTCSSKMEGSGQRLKNGSTVESEPFIWEEGKVLVADDYDERPVCGGGLHGLRDGLGNWSLLDWDPNAIAVIFENVDCPVIAIDDEKVKVQKAQIVKIGPLPTLLAEFLPNYIRELTSILEVDVITISRGSDNLTNDKRNAQIGSSGNYAKIGSSGYSAQIGSSGDYAQIGSSGDYAQIGSSGKDSVIASAGLNGKAKIGENGAIALTYTDSADRYRIAVGYEGEGLKAGVWYSVNSNGEFIEVPE